MAKRKWKQPPEPPLGSVVVLFGDVGTAWQRLSSDGLWHSTAGGAATWAHLCQMDRVRPVRIVHYASEK